jgi:hypothetical protein
MRNPSFSSVAALVALLFALGGTVDSAFSQAKVSIGKFNVNTIESPQFNLQGSKKPFKPEKGWLEAEVIFQVSSSKPPKDGYLPDALEIDIFLVVKGGDGKKKLVKHSGTYANVAVGKNQAVAVYLPPREFARLTGKPRPSKGELVGYAVNIKYAGKSVAAEMRKMTKEQTEISPEMELLPKNKTPFRDLYYDNYLNDSSS